MGELQKVEGKQIDVSGGVSLTDIMTLARDVDMDKLEKIIELKNREEDRIKKQAFDEAFVLMKKELPQIVSTKKAKDRNGDEMYRYAPLSEIQKACDPILEKHGFTYHWTEEMRDEEKRKRVYFHLSHIAGHTQTNYFDVGILQTNNRTNIVQVAAQMSTYGQRHSMRAGLGVVIVGEDNDAQTDGTEELDDIVMDYRENILNSTTIVELKSSWAEAYKHFKDNKKAQSYLAEIYNEMKQKFLQEPPV